MKRFVLALAALTMGSSAWAAIPNPPPLASDKSVVDAADILTPAQEAQVEAQSRQIYNATHHHVVVLTMPTLNGVSATDYIHQAFSYYKLGNRQRNDGVLLLVSVSNPRRLQIQAGSGLQGVITDAIAPQITDRMKPVMKSGDYFGAITQGVEELGQLSAKEVVTQQRLTETAGNTATPLERADAKDAFLTVLLVLGIVGFAGGLYYFAIIRPRSKRREELQAKLNSFYTKARRAVLSGKFDDAEQHYRSMMELEPYNSEALQGLSILKRYREEAFQTTTFKPTPPVYKPSRADEERISKTFAESSKPAAPAKQATSRSTTQAEIFAAEQERQRQQRRDRWASSSSSSSSSSSYDWGSSSSSSSSSYDSGGSSMGGGGGSDW